MRQPSDEGARAAERRGHRGQHVGEERVALGQLGRAAVAAVERARRAVLQRRDQLLGVAAVLAEAPLAVVGRGARSR